MSIKKGAAAVAVGFFVCIAPMGLRSTAVAQHEAGEGQGRAQITKAVAILLPTKGSKAEGRVTFAQVEGGIQVQAEIRGLTPGEHGFHIHEFGVWSPDAMAAGGHFNPDKPRARRAAQAAKRHVGDLGNITANANGNATLDFVDPHLTFRGPHSIIGRGLVVHEKADDLKTQPTGNAGGRVAVGVIGVAKP